MHFVRDSRRDAYFSRINLVAALIGKVLNKFNALPGNDFAVGPGIVHILTAKFLWGAHTNQRRSTRTKIHFANRAGEASRSPPLHHILRVRPGLPPLFNRFIEDEIHNHIALLWFCAHFDDPFFTTRYPRCVTRGASTTRMRSSSTGSMFR